MTTCFRCKSNYFKWLFGFLPALLVVLSSQTAVAHRVVVFAWIDGDTVFTESQFPDGRKIANGQVYVLDAEGNRLLEGKTDDNGDFSFTVPKITALTIVLEAGMGHQGEWKLSEDEITSAMGVNEKPLEPETTGAGQDMDGTLKKAPSGPAMSDASGKTEETGIFLSENQLNRMVETAVENALDKKLQPVTGMLAQISARLKNQGPTVNDIFGGIGYILGLMGVAAYMLSRKKS